MAFPYQCLVVRNSTSHGTNSWDLYGASGTQLVVQSSTGAKSVWPPKVENVRDDQDDDQERPGKRVKLSPQTPTQKSNFSHLVLSSDGQHLVAVTGEDKCVRVFEIDSNGSLNQLSERCMPRRPSSIVLTSDNSTILCADKFGDVYALPLVPGPEEEKPSTPVVEEAEPQKDYAPSATVLTVHSGRNRKTLEEQLKQKAKAPKTKEVATFRHDLLLGHVSMLTDLVYAQVENRSYIITADRDEHIRISRGQPQAHIIEGFCFGHEEFVSRLCLTLSGLLVSGGGDPDLYVWDWQKYKLLYTLPLRDQVLQHVQSRPELSAVASEPASFKVAVSGIWDAAHVDPPANNFAVACEGIPALFFFNLDRNAEKFTAIPIQGNVLDVAFVQTSQSSWTLVVSTDNVHKPGSTTELQTGQTTPRIQCFTLVDGKWQQDPSVEEKLEWFAQQGCEVQVQHTTEDQAGNASGSGSRDDKAVRDILYGVENLRKRPGGED